MPKNLGVWYSYGGTITFNSHWDMKEKTRFIKCIKDFFEKVFYGKDVSIVLKYAVEYHKVGQEDDLEAPHIHFILEVNKKLGKRMYDRILKCLKDVGRSQFYLMTTLKTKQYTKYIQKDYEKNSQLDERQGYKHYLGMRIEPMEQFYNELNAYQEESDSEY